MIVMYYQNVRLYEDGVIVSQPPWLISKNKRESWFQSKIFRMSRRWELMAMEKRTPL